MAEEGTYWTVQTEGSMLSVRTSGDSVAAVLEDATYINCGGEVFVRLMDEPAGMVPVPVLVRVGAISTIEPERREEIAPT